MVTLSFGIAVEQQFVVFGISGALALAVLQSPIVDALVPARTTNPCLTATGSPVQATTTTLPRTWPDSPRGGRRQSVAVPRSGRAARGDLGVEPYQPGRGGGRALAARSPDPVLRNGPVVDDRADPFGFDVASLGAFIEWWVQRAPGLRP